MSGGHWNYLASEFEERATFTSDCLRVLGAIEHELDWAISGDTCMDCAKERTIAGLLAFFDQQANNDTEDPLMVLRNRSENRCERCAKREVDGDDQG